MRLLSLLSLLFFLSFSSFAQVDDFFELIQKYKVKKAISESPEYGVRVFSYSKNCVTEISETENRKDTCNYYFNSKLKFDSIIDTESRYYFYYDSLGLISKQVRFYEGTSSYEIQLYRNDSVLIYHYGKLFVKSKPELYLNSVKKRDYDNKYWVKEVIFDSTPIGSGVFSKRDSTVRVYDDKSNLIEEIGYAGGLKFVKKYFYYKNGLLKKIKKKQTVMKPKFLVFRKSEKIKYEYYD